MKLRKGKTKNILDRSIDSALLGVEVYNKPRTTFRSEAYITLMVIAWTRLLHAHFQNSIGDKYYYRSKNGRYLRVDGERKAWELLTCIKKSSFLRPAVLANLNFFVGLRNKIEHRHVAPSDVDTLIFGECQALLYNFERTLVHLFGDEYVLNENLAYALQFSSMRTPEQREASRTVLSAEMRSLHAYVERYRSALPNEVFDSQEYSVKLIQVPKIANTSRNDLAVEFVRWSELSDTDRENYDQLVTIIKDTVIKKEVVNVGRLRAGDVVARVREGTKAAFTHFDHRCIYFLFSVRPLKEEGRDPFDTDTRFCHYDEVHEDYVYQEAWVELLTALLLEQRLTHEEIRDSFRARKKLLVEDFSKGLKG
jgi:hypothetical protein